MRRCAAEIVMILYHSDDDDDRNADIIRTDAAAHN